MGNSAGNIDALTDRIRVRVSLANAAACVVFSFLLMFYSVRAVPGFATGFIVGALNIFWLIRTTRRGMGMDAVKAGKLMSASYKIRLAAVAVIFAALIKQGIFTPWPLVAGLTAAIITTICTMVYLAKEEASHA